ncbi:MetQ/NlpA family ABC transporter substrate-binding protein [Corynebacterium kalidii]|uniref:MetQ/NlpA family ABC transporter substrate-binding protein n=1 Tax=Corynebacterium kalidii TaxID=2931982 RepID=A0A9X1WIA3_9CORY|nr:MetQ/NlpA family ABC transporter substrate-binding protein [Corynebacterium kalidii]MCJ7857935.1 MetQ/NlpA family ABC transporter substrate-binding protein [Corynebacterium kalidii]
MITRLKKAAVIGAVATLSAAGLTACMSDGGDGDSDTIRIGSTEADKSQWQVFQEKAEEEGLDVDVVSFTDYSMPNKALAEGELDVNQFQHIQFLAEENVKADYGLVPFGASQTFPMGVYAKNYSSVEEIAEAGDVVIPNDTTNQGRAIKVLAAAGLVTLRDDDLLTPTPADIVAEESDVTVTPVDASQTAVAYNDGQASVINNNFLAAADVDANDAVFKDNPDDPSSQPYINVWVTTEENKDDEDYRKLVEIWHSDEVQEAVANDTAGTAVSAENSPEELRDILADTEQKIREQGGADE